MTSVASCDSASSEPAARSRRSAVLRLGSGGLAVLLASKVMIVAAQEASPRTGMPAAGRAYLVTR